MPTSLSLFALFEDVTGHILYTFLTDLIYVRGVYQTFELSAQSINCNKKVSFCCVCDIQLERVRKRLVVAVFERERPMLCGMCLHCFFIIEKELTLDFYAKKDCVINFYEFF